MPIPPAHDHAPGDHTPCAFALGAHPDDVEIYCLGLLLRLRDAGWRIGWAIATDGARGGDPTLRRAEALTSAALFGVTPVCLDLADGALAAEPAAAAAVAQALGDTAPDLVITHTPYDYHPDHRALARLVTEAAPYDSNLIYADGLYGTGPEPDVWIDITAVAAAKAAALACHRSQAGSLAPDRLNAWSGLRGAQTFDPEVRHAEAFTFARWNRARSLRRLAPILGSSSLCLSLGEDRPGILREKRVN